MSAPPLILVRSESSPPCDLTPSSGDLLGRMRPLLPAGGHTWSPLISRYVYGLASCPLGVSEERWGQYKEAGKVEQEGVGGRDV